MYKFDIIKYQIKNVKKELLIEYLSKIITKIHFSIIKISTAIREYFTILKMLVLSAKNFTDKNLNNSTSDRYLRLSNMYFSIV